MMNKYDFDGLKENFGDMDNMAIINEYVAIMNAISLLNAKVGTCLKESVYFEYIEPLLDAKQYIEGYLCGVLLSQSGFITKDVKDYTYWIAMQ